MASWIQTLGDAKDIGQELIAICHNPACRHTRLVNLDKVIYHVGAATPLIPLRGKVHFSERMRCPACKHRGMFIWIREPKFPEPLFDVGANQVNIWSKNGGRLEYVAARTGNILIGRAAFMAALDAYPYQRITLQAGARVIEDNRFRVLAGGKK